MRVFSLALDFLDVRKAHPEEAGSNRIFALMNCPFVLLLLEDSEEDIFLFRRAISKLDRDVALHCVRNGGEAQKYLRGEEKYANRAEFPIPSVVFSDLQLPGMGGLEFLAWLRSDPVIRALPCVIYSGSANPSDVQAAYEAGVTSFIVKPLDFAEWVTRLEVMLKFWMDIAQHPPIDA
jgi:CheY-like chemotaxis protein